MSRSLPPNICDWVPREHLTGLLVNEPTNSDVLGVPTSICTAVITVPNESGDTLLVSLGGTSPARGLLAATDNTNNIARQLG